VSLETLKAKVDKYTPGFYRMIDDPEATDRAAVRISRDEAARWNTPELGYGIFMTVNAFDGPRRKEYLTRICAWAIDMDAGTKMEQRRRLLASPLVPSLIVDTKAGYHAWWLAQAGAKPEHWNAIVLERLVPWFGSDKNARDLCRILRAPGYLHLKDPANPFKCRIAWRHDVSYSERQMADAFPWVPDKKAAEEEKRREAERVRRSSATYAIVDTFWDAVYNLDCEEGLRRLSGHWACRGEHFTFSRTGRGNLNIFADKKSTPCFVDENRRIGSPSGGGPTLAQWLRWYGHDWKTVVAVLKEVFPQLDEIDRAEKAAKHPHARAA